MFILNLQGCKDIGFTLEDINEDVVATNIHKNQSEIPKDDVITHVNGVDVEGMSSNQIKDFISYMVLTVPMFKYQPVDRIV